MSISLQLLISPEFTLIAEIASLIIDLRDPAQGREGSVPTSPLPEPSMAEKFETLRERLFSDATPLPPPSVPHVTSRPSAFVQQETRASPPIVARPVEKNHIPREVASDQSGAPSEQLPVANPAPATTLVSVETGPARNAANRPRRWKQLSAATLVTAVTVTGIAAWLTLTRHERNNDDTHAEEIVARDNETFRGSSAVVRLDGASSTSVSVQLRLAEPTTILTVSVPTVSADLGLTAFSPVVSNVRVLDAGRQIGATLRSLQPGDEVSLFLSQSTQSPVLEYSVAGVIAKSRPSPPGRASMLVSPLVVENTPAQLTKVRLSGLHVLNVGCVSARQDSEACGRQTARGWVVQRSGSQSTSTIVASVDLPRKRPTPSQ
ncbi:MAG: hypothetical protein ACR2LE_08385 [Nocardioidaceae bacterium]